MKLIELLKKPFMPLGKIETPTAYQVLVEPLNNVSLQRETEMKFFASLRLRNGVTRFTYENRLETLDDWLIGFLSSRSFHRILDVGISSGITTVELGRKLEKGKYNFEIIGIDKQVDAFLIRFDEQNSVLIDTSGFPLHFEINGRGFGYVSGTNVINLARRRYLGKRAIRIFNLTRSNRFHENPLNSRKDFPRILKTRLLCNEIQGNQLIKVREADIFTDDVGSDYSLVRVANLFNESYFSRLQLVDGIEKIRSLLKIEGYLLVCRTNSDGVTNATLFNLNNKRRFRVVQRFGNGSEIESLVR
ncbi:MAG TPA: hypothetical protein PKD24_16115 [Pyrinomonadaceae bacterium]|nr:hypothetical protein [Pyrinomonadaceae bacterium]HMP66857.1 hypothetical protein [Pyrinomonadaceae bacterium]